MLSEIKDFVNWIRRRNPHARTWKDYSYDLSQFSEITGDIPPNQVSVQLVDLFVKVQSDRRFSPATINRRLAAISSFFSYLACEDPDLRCPVHPGRHKLRERQRLPRPVPQKDLLRFFQVIESTRDRAMFLLMLRCGLRIAEVAGLQMQDLFLSEPQPRMIVRGKGGKERSVYLTPQALQALHVWLEQRLSSPCACIFLSYQNNGLSTTAIHKRLMRYRETAGVSFSAHNLRHTFANDLLTADVPVTSIQRLLGHRWLETTQTYVAANDSQVREDFFQAASRIETWQAVTP